MRRTEAAVAVLALVDLVQLAALLVLVAIPLRAGVVSPFPSPLVVAMLALFLFLGPVLGALVASRRPENPTGWLFLVMAFLLGFGYLSDELARHLPPGPQVGLYVSIASDVGSLWTVALTLLTSLFPTGRLLGRRWWLVVALPLIATAGQIVAGLLAPDGGISPPIAGLTYPLGRPELQPALDVLSGAAALLLAAGLVGYFAMLRARWVRSRGVEREQLKWFLWAMVVIVLVLLVDLAVNVVSSDWGNAGWAIFQGSLVLLPVAAAVAILRYRLFDIDLIIRRTAVYALLSVVLVIVYAASVIALSQVLTPITHGSSLAVAVATLLVAALFQPARRRVQLVVDRRFYRARYDARRELEGFRSRLREQLDAERLAGDVAAMAIRTMQPDSVSVWLRQPHRATVTLPERATRKIQP